LKTAGT